MDVLESGRDSSVGNKVDVRRGGKISRVSSDCFSRPADERYLSFRISTPRFIVGPDEPNPAGMLLGADTLITPTHRSFSRLAGLVGLTCDSSRRRWPPSTSRTT